MDQAKKEYLSQEMKKMHERARKKFGSAGSSKVEKGKRKAPSSGKVQTKKKEKRINQAIPKRTYEKVFKKVAGAAVTRFAGNGLSEELQRFCVAELHQSHFIESKRYGEDLEGPHAWEEDDTIPARNEGISGIRYEGDFDQRSRGGSLEEIGEDGSQRGSDYEIDQTEGGMATDGGRNPCNSLSSGADGRECDGRNDIYRSHLRRGVLQLDQPDARISRFSRRVHRTRHKRSGSKKLALGSMSLSEIGQFNPAFSSFEIYDLWKEGTRGTLWSVTLVKNPFQSLDWINAMYYNSALAEKLKVPRIELLKMTIDMPDPMRHYFPMKRLNESGGKNETDLRGYLNGWYLLVYFNNLTAFVGSGEDEPFDNGATVTSYVPRAWENSSGGKLGPSEDSVIGGTGFIQPYTWVTSDGKAYIQEKGTTFLMKEVNNMMVAERTMQMASADKSAGSYPGALTIDFHVNQRHFEKDFTDGSGRGIFLGSNKVHFEHRLSEASFLPTNATNLQRSQNWANVAFTYRIHWESIERQRVIDEWNRASSAQENFIKK